MAESTVCQGLLIIVRRVHRICAAKKNGPGVPNRSRDDEELGSAIAVIV